MITNFKREGNTLTLTIELAKVPYQSKSAVEKAAKEWVKAHGKPDGFDPSKVPPTMLASTGGFQRCGDAKVSLNITVA